MNYVFLFKKLLLVCLGMFVFVFVLVLFYDVFCDVIGLNGKLLFE